MRTFEEILEADYHITLEDNRRDESVKLAVEKYAEQLKKETKNALSGSLILHDLMQVANIKNEDGMPVIEYVDKPNGGSVAYVRHDAMVKKINTILKIISS